MTDLLTEPLSQIRTESIRWLWEPYLPRGKVVLLDSDPGVGKSLLTIDLAARLSRGRPLPVGPSPVRSQTTLLLNAEDDPADTTRPRAEAAGADLDRVIVASAGRRIPMILPADAAGLHALIHRHQADFVVLDPLTVFLGRENAVSSEPSVRQVLGQLAAIAEECDCTILLVRHLRKKDSPKAIYRGLGSIGITACVRTMLLAAPHPHDATLGVLAVPKSNLVKAVPALGYRIASDQCGRARIEWTGPIEVDSNALGKVLEPLRPRHSAALWLRAALANGPRKSVEVLAAAAEAGIPEQTLRRAKQDLRVRSHQTCRGGTMEWYWSDPAAPWPDEVPFEKPFTLPPLEELI